MFWEQVRFFCWCHHLLRLVAAIKILCWLCGNRWLCRNRWLCGNLRVGTAGPPKYSTPWLLWTLWILWGPPLSFFGNITHLKSVIHLGLPNFSCNFSQWWLNLKSWSLFYLKMSFITYSSLPHKIFDSLICLRTEVRGDFNIHGTKYF